MQELRREHDEQLQRLKQMKDQEVEAVTSATLHSRYRWPASRPRVGPWPRCSLSSGEAASDCGTRGHPLSQPLPPGTLSSADAGILLCSAPERFGAGLPGFGPPQVPLSIVGR